MIVSRQRLRRCRRRSSTSFDDCCSTLLDNTNEVTFQPFMISYHISSWLALNQCIVKIRILGCAMISQIATLLPHELKLLLFWQADFGLFSSNAVIANQRSAPIFGALFMAISALVLRITYCNDSYIFTRIFVDCLTLTNKDLPIDF